MAGGVKIETGLDANANNTLDAGEVAQTKYVCNATTALAYGIQTNVALTSYTNAGWSVCYTGTYNDTKSIAAATAACTGTQMTIACRETGSATLALAASDLKTNVMHDVGSGSTAFYASNGVAWYYAGSYSWGFFEPGDGVNRNSCDTATGSYPGRRMCWHTDLDSLIAGYRCGNSYPGDDHERLVLTR